MATTRVISVQPYGQNPQDRGEDNELIQLSDLDLFMPKLYVHMIEVFSLPADADRQKVLSDLAEGLSHTLADYPVLTGTLHFDNEARRVVVKRGPGSSVDLRVKEPGPNGEIDIKSFSFLDKNDFPVHHLDASKVLPAHVVLQLPIPAQDISTEGPCCLSTQVTFIEGGVILGLAVTHQVCDGPGCEALLTNWARYSFAVANGLPVEHSASIEKLQDRSILRRKGKSDGFSQEERKALEDRYPTFKARDGPPAPPPADFKMPVVKTRIWHVSKTKLQELKTLASATSSSLPASENNGDSENDIKCDWVSTYDALIALLWRAVIRAKMPFLKPDPAAPSKTIHAVNARGRAVPLPEEYIGVAVTLPWSPSHPISRVLSPDFAATLPLLARTVRVATNSVTPPYLDGLLDWGLACEEDMRWTELNMHMMLGVDCMIFDWHTMKSYSVHDFGFGKPAALRWPNPQFEGFAFILPTRTTKGNEDEGLEICLGIEESCHERLDVDEELLRFAEQRGVGV